MHSVRYLNIHYFVYSLIMIILERILKMLDPPLWLNLVQLFFLPNNTQYVFTDVQTHISVSTPFVYTGAGIVYKGFLCSFLVVWKSIKDWSNKHIFYIYIKSPVLICFFSLVCKLLRCMGSLSLFIWFQYHRKNLLCFIF